ncbi:MAG: [protein-PII] uridylyltransferase [Gammaproteobacteria bacterium]|jgi:[protein-PII] uridylyltransferase
MTADTSTIFEPGQLESIFARDTAASITAFRELQAEVQEQRRQQFNDGVAVETLVHERADTIDRLIRAVWQHQAARIARVADLVAVGGYGRGELHPHSDIDLLVLVENDLPAEGQEEISRFLTFLWDIGLEVGHSVRTLDDCAEQASKDVTVLTTLMETRLLEGAGLLFAQLPDRISVDQCWNAAEFFEAKVAEQRARHGRYHDTAYNLEPNVKGSPGGLRDIQTINWIARRALGASHLEDLVGHGFLTEGQLRILLAGRSFLWKIRYALHMLTGRREDRLLFDHQVRLAEMLGYEDATFTLAVEQLMQRYYRTVMELSRINEMLLQLFEEAILLDKDAPATPLGPHFQARNGYLEAIDNDVFLREPSTLLELFLLLEQQIDLKGVNAHTIALIKQHLWLIDEEFRQNPRHHRLFLEILRAPQGVSRTLKRMNTYGVLGLYLPAFGRIVGRMQYDLFHAYTVDQHTLFVVENLRRLSLPRFNEEFPNASAIMQALEKPDIAILAGLFHDIAKGRGGDHSELGATDAMAFCLEHGMSRYDARLVAWLVRHHLLLSMTAQKQDVNDPQVINEFARLVGDLTHLDYLYVLTVADVRATNPDIWNSWKDKLFWELYQGTKRALRRGAADPIDREELIAETRERASEILGESEVARGRWEALWNEFSDEYFFRHRAREVAWHTEMLTRDKTLPDMLVEVSNSITPGLTVLMVYSSNRRSYLHTTAILAAMGFNVVDARIILVTAEHNLNTYCLLDSDGNPISDPVVIGDLKFRISEALTRGQALPERINRRTPRQVRMFSTPVQVTMMSEPANQRTVVELVAADRPGLLYEVCQVLERLGVELLNAKVATIGERAEDVFFVTGANNGPLDEAESQALKLALEEALSEPAAQAAG